MSRDAELRALPPADDERPAIVRAGRDAARAARFALSASTQTVSWSAATTVRAGRFIVRAAITGTAPRAVLDEAVDQLRRELGLGPPDATGTEAVSQLITEHLPAAPRPLSAPTLPERFAALLDASADVELHYEGHPAYLRLVNELDPDEARILRLLATAGPQPALDVRTKRLFGVGSRLLAPGITMIGAYAGLANKARVPAYLNNLNRLGLIWFSREMLQDEHEYHLLEAQPEVLEAFKGQKIDTVLRSIELTAFGKNLCALCGLLPAAEIDARATLAEVSRALPPPDAR